MINLKNYNIILGVTGSIAIYKSLELVRLFVKANANVKIIMSNSAKNFITPLSFESLSSNVVLHEETESWANENNHIKFTKNAHCFIIAPATANTINKLAYGISDNLLLQSALAWNKKLIIAPSANTNMIQNPATKEAIKVLENRGHIFLKTQTKLLACNDFGSGAMSEPESIFYKTARFLKTDNFWENKKVVITGGGTSEDIDFVRTITNKSSGKMANALAMATYTLGANVVLISSKEKDENLDVSYMKYTNSDSLQKALSIEAKDADFIFMAAAVSDFVPQNTNKEKIKKSSIKDIWKLELKQNIDILENLKDTKAIKIGFKAETDSKNAKKYAKEMLINKNLDMVCLNILDEKMSFGSDENEILLINKENEILLSKDKKFELSLKLLEEVKKLCD